ncbi:hypothetical protein ACSSS7_000118 [Eimeria intestinalis]
MEAAAASSDAPMCTRAFSAKTYWGRFFSFVQQMDPRLLWASEHEMREAKRMGALADAGAWRELRSEGITDRQLRRNLLIRDACINPSSGEPIPSYLRLAAVAPLNIPICAGLLLTAPTVANSVFWQWINQTYSAAFNYAQGNHPQTKDEREKQMSNLIRGYRRANRRLVFLLFFDNDKGIHIFSRGS